MEEVAVNASQLSPQLQLLISMEMQQKEMQKQLTLVTEKAEEAAATITNIKDTIIQNKDDWRKWQEETFNSAVLSSPERDFQGMRRWTYEELERRSRCRLGVQLNNLKGRMADSGAAKSKINAISKLDVIENDVRLKEIYTTIIKEFSIRYVS